MLAISSLLGSPQSEANKQSFENAVELLRQLDRCGNFAAKEFCEHIDAMQQSMATVSDIISLELVSHAIPDEDPDVPASLTRTGLTAGMALAQPSFQDLLANADFEMQGFDDSASGNLSLFSWPEIWGDQWAPIGPVS